MTDESKQVAKEQPRFDFSNLTWGESKRLTLLGQRAREGATAADMETLFAEMQAMLAKVVLSVPRSWLVKDAPEQLDWTDPASFDWLRADRMQQLQEMLADARRPEALTGNSPAR